MRKITQYNIIINNIIYFTTMSHKALIDEFERIRKTEPTAWVQTCYC